MRLKLFMFMAAMVATATLQGCMLFGGSPFKLDNPPMVPPHDLDVVDAVSMDQAYSAARDTFELFLIHVELEQDTELGRYLVGRTADGLKVEMWLQPLAPDQTEININIRPVPNEGRADLIHLRMRQFYKERLEATVR